MTSKGDVEDEPRTVSKGTFGCLVAMTVPLLFAAQMAAAWALGRALGFPLSGGWIGGLALPNFILARVAVDGIMKRLGLSRSGKTLEVRTRAAAVPEGEVGDDERVEVRCPPSFVTGLGVTCLLVCLAILLILAAIPHERIEVVGCAYAFAAFFGLGGICCFYENRWGKPQAWADASGVWALPVGFHFEAKFVPWSDVATCEIETYHDTFGKPIIVRPILNGAEGKPLLIPNLLYTRFEDQERLIKYIKAKLPKPAVDLWD